MNSGQRKAGEEAAFIAQWMCCVCFRVIMLDFLIPQKCDFETLPNLIGALFGNDASTGHSVERRNEEALSGSSLAEIAFIGFQQSHWLRNMSSGQFSIC